MLNLNFNPFPTLYSERLILRQITLNDSNELFELRSNKQIMDALDKEPLTAIEEAISFIEAKEVRLQSQLGINWAVCLKENNKFIGDFGFHIIDAQNQRAEIGYALFPQFHNIGIANEAINLIIKHAFEQLNLHSIEANINPANSASEKLLLKNGFTKEAHFKENYFFRGEFLDSAIYSLLKSCYLKQQCST